MKTLILTAALPFFICTVRAQDTPQAKDAHVETVKKAHAAAWLGIAMAEDDGKVVIGQIVPDSPAAKAGLQAGDCVLRIGDIAMEGNMRLVIEKVGQQKPGDTIELHWKRGDKEETTRIELAERPAQLEGEFRGEFRREKEQIREKAEEGKKKLEGEVERKPSKEHPERDLSLESPRKDWKLNKDDAERMLRFYFDRKWPSDKAEGAKEEWMRRPGFELPLLEKLKGQRPGARMLELMSKGNPAVEAAIWKRVQESISRALKESDIGPDVREKVMKAVEEARRSGSEKDAGRAKLEAEAARLDKELQALKERSEKLREELKKTKE